MVISLHTSGDLMQWHPHAHAIALSGTIEAGEFTKADNINTVELEASFQRQVLDALVEKELLDLDSAVNLASWQHSGFSAWVGEPFTDNQQRLFIARYLKKHTFSHERLKLPDLRLAPLCKSSSRSMTATKPENYHRSSFWPNSALMCQTFGSSQCGISAHTPRARVGPRKQPIRFNLLLNLSCLLIPNNPTQNNFVNLPHFGLQTSNVFTKSIR
jgi:hypothetical protein